MYTVNTAKQISSSPSGTRASDQSVSFPSSFGLPSADHEVSQLQLFLLYWAVDSALREFNRSFCVAISRNSLCFAEVSSKSSHG